MNNVAKTQEKSVSSVVNCLIVFALAWAALVVINAPAWSHEHHQVDWVPNNYIVTCHTPPCVLEEAVKTRSERLMAKAVTGIKGMGYDAPKFWGGRIGKGTPDDAIELYEAGSDIAGASPRCKEGDKSRAGMVIGSEVAEYSDRDYLLYYFMAHEVFHLIQFSYPFWNEEKCDKHIPGWILEGTADAVGLESMRKSYPSVAPSDRDDREARKFSGLRRYDIPLPHRRECVIKPGIVCGPDGELWTGDPTYYNTSSFWRHLANAHYRGKYDYLARYMKKPANDGNWVNWLRTNVETDTGAHLGMVFSGFLADYSGWGDPRFPGQYYGREHWLKEVYGGCETLYLDKEDADGYVDIELRPMSGECIKVAVSALGESGLSTDESAAVQVAAIVMDGSRCSLDGGLAGPMPCSLDGLHLSLAASNDKERFHCAREVKRRGRQGVGRCVFVPDDGEVHLPGGQEYARVWNVRSQEKADQAQKRQEQGEGKGNLVNLYTISYTPVDISTHDTKFGGTDPVAFRLYFVLDVAKLDVEDPKSRPAARSRAKAVASFTEGADPQTTLPKQDERGMPANSYSLPANLRPAIPMPSQGSGVPVPERLAQLTVSEGQAASVVIHPLRQLSNGKYEEYALSVGETGDFPAQLTVGNINGEPLAATSIGSLMVEEFTDLVFRASYSGTLCRVAEIRPGKPCPNPVQFSGNIVKAFAGSRLPGRYMRIARTPGTEMYRRAAEAGFAEWGDAMPGESASGKDSPVTGAPSRSGDSLTDCACTCEEREATERAAQDMKRREAAGETLEPGEIMRLASCTSPCQRQYMICELEKGKGEKRQAEKAEVSPAPEECDCSCEALGNMESQLSTVLARVEPGDAAAMAEMKRMGQCVALCQDSLVACALAR